MKHILYTCGMMAWLLMAAATMACAKEKRQPKYPCSSNMIGLVGGVFITSNPDMSGYNTKKSYVDYGGGLVYDYRKEYSEHSAFEYIMSGLLASSNTSHTDQGEDKMKVTLPVELRFYLGFSQLKFYLGAGLQYNFIWSIKSSDATYTYTYDGYGTYTPGGTDESTGAHQLSGNGSLGLCVLGLQSKVHFLIGAKFHFPIINNAEGTEYLNGSKIDLSKDKTNVAATAGISVDLGDRGVLMLNYDYPLGSNAQSTVSTSDTRNFFERHSQSITMNLMLRL